MGQEQKISGRNAVTLDRVQDLRMAAAHLQCALVALGYANASVTAAYVEHALHYCKTELLAAQGVESQH